MSIAKRHFKSVFHVLFLPKLVCGGKLPVICGIFKLPGGLTLLAPLRGTAPLPSRAPLVTPLPGYARAGVNT